MAAGFAYAFRAPVGAKSIDAYNPNHGSSPVGKTFAVSYHNPQEVTNSIVPVYHPAPAHQETHPLIPQEIKTQYHSQDELGQYAFGYVHNDASHHEERTLNGGVSGSYSYYDDAGVKQTANYVADRLGYRVDGTNFHSAVPVPVSLTPEVEAATAAHLKAVNEVKARKLHGRHIHVGIGETPEVAEARAAHLRAYNKIKEEHSRRWRRSAHRLSGYGFNQGNYQQGQNSGYQNYQQPYQGPLASHTIGIPVTDTPEVQAAKQAHFYAYDQISRDHARRWKRSAHRFHESQSLGYNQHYQQPYQGPLASHTLGIPVTETPEVAAATHAHLNALHTAHKYGGAVNVGIPDTPEVQAAKQAHFYAFDQISRDHARRWKRNAHRFHGSQSLGYNQHYQQPYQGPLASHTLGIPVTETPEVAAATHAHLNALHTAYKYGGTVNVGIPDTPEVQAAKQAHFYAYDQISRDHARRWKRSAHRLHGSQPFGHSSGYQNQQQFSPQGHHSGLQYHQSAGNYNPQGYAPFQVPVPVTPTPAVQAATYAHLQAVNQAHRYGGNVHVGIPDTPAVAAAKQAHLQAYDYIARDHAQRRW